MYIKTALLISILCLSASLYGQNPPPDIKVYFSPGGGVTDALVQAINNATSSVLVEAYSFTSHKITAALVKAKQRGVDVRVILDGSNLKDKYSDLPKLIQGGVPTWIDSTFKIAHDKVMIIDGRLVTTGSFNDSWAAETENSENLVFITDLPTAATFTARWGQLVGVSARYGSQ